MARLINGKQLAQEIQRNLSATIANIKDKVTPTLATVLVGERPDSRTYLRLKRIAAEAVGIKVKHVELPATTSEASLLSLIDTLNHEPTVHGLIVQLPLPEGLCAHKVCRLISPVKDVDGIHPLNVGLLATKGAEPYHVPCTPLGIATILERHNVRIAGSRVAVIGRSAIVGHPVAQLMTKKDATVTLCHSRTENLKEVVRQCDIVISACACHHLVRGDWIKPGATVIDVGINSVKDSTKKAGYRLEGDVCFEEARQVAGLITPVPGGVGPMTIAMLLANTTRAAMCQSSLLKCDFESVLIPPPGGSS